MSGAVHDIITRANCFGVARGRIFSVSIDLLCRLYNTLALPCECVMMTMITKIVSEKEFSKHACSCVAERSRNHRRSWWPVRQRIIVDMSGRRHGFSSSGWRRANRPLRPMPDPQLPPLWLILQQWWVKTTPSYAIIIIITNNDDKGNDSISDNNKNKQ